MSPFQAGGALREGSLYIERRADAELRDAIDAGGLAAVIAPRQMGKSSLRRRAEHRLRSRSARSFSVDLALIGSLDLTEAAWLTSLSLLLADRAGLEGDPLRASTLPGFTRFLAEELPGAAIFLDEIDVALGLPFPTDGFFSALAAAASPRLSIVALGVTEPARWTRHPVRVIRPERFTPQEAAAFLPGLRAAGGDAGALLAAVLARTGGHPYLTQRICELLARAGTDDGGAPEDRVARAVDEGLGEDPARDYLE